MLCCIDARQASAEYTLPQVALICSLEGGTKVEVELSNSDIIRDGIRRVFDSKNIAISKRYISWYEDHGFSGHENWKIDRVTGLVTRSLYEFQNGAGKTTVTSGSCVKDEIPAGKF
jgi:hypothetical protein